MRAKPAKGAQPAIPWHPICSYPDFTDVFNMKSKIHIGGFILFLFEFAAATMVGAQGTLYVSSLGTTNPIFVGLGANYWMAQPFETGPASSAYTLDSVQMLMLVTGTSSGYNLQVSLYSDNGGEPGSNLAPLSGSDPTVQRSLHLYRVGCRTGSFDNLLDFGHVRTCAKRFPGFFVGSHAIHQLCVQRRLGFGRSFVFH